MILSSAKGVYIVLRWLFQAINRLKQEMEKDKIRHKGKLKSPSSGPLQGESAEEFFARMARESAAPKPNDLVEPGKVDQPRLKLRPEHKAVAAALAANDFIPKKQERLSDEEYFRKLEEENDSGINDVKPVKSISRKRKSNKARHFVNRKNLKSFKHGIIMNEVLNRPKAYEL